MRKRSLETALRLIGGIATVTEKAEYRARYNIATYHSERLLVSRACEEVAAALDRLDRRIKEKE